MRVQLEVAVPVRRHREDRQLAHAVGQHRAVPHRRPDRLQAPPTAGLCSMIPNGPFSRPCRSTSSNSWGPVDRGPPAISSYSARCSASSSSGVGIGAAGSSCGTVITAPGDGRRSRVAVPAVSDTRGSHEVRARVPRSGPRPARLEVGRAPARRRRTTGRGHPRRGRQARRRASAWTRSPPRPARARPSSTGTSPTAPSSTSPSAPGWPSQLLPKLRDAIESSEPARAQMVAAAIDTYLAFLEADPELYRFVVHQQVLDRPADRDPINSLSDLVGEQAAADRRPGAAARRPRSGGRRALGPRRRRAGPLGRRLVASRRSPHAPHRTRRTPDRSRLGRPVRRRDPRTPDQHGGKVTTSLPASVDPKAIQEVLDGRWAHVRRDARENLNDPDFLPVYGENVQEARERVTRAAKKLADSGRVGFGFPKEYGGEDDAGGSVDLDRDAGVRRPVADGQGRRPVGPVRRRAAAAGHQAAARQVPARRHELRPARLLRDDRDRPRLRRPAAADDVHLRPRDRDLRPAHPAPGRPQGLHRQRGQGRPDGGRLRPADHPGQEPRRARLAGADPRRGRHALPGRHHRGRRPEGRPQRRRQRPADLRPRDASPATCCSTATARSPPTAPTPARSRTRPAASSRCSARWCAAGSASAARPRRRPSWPSTSPSATATCAASSPPPATSARSSSTTTWCTSASCCRRWPPPTRCTSRRASWSSTMHDVQTRRHDELDEEAQRELESRAAGLKVAQTWHATRDHPDVPRGLRRRRLPAGEPAAAPQGRHRRLHHVRGRQHRPAAAGRQGPAHRLPRRVRLAGGLGQGRLHRRHGPRDRAGADGGPRADRPAGRRRPGPGRRGRRCSTAAGS